MGRRVCLALRQAMGLGRMGLGRMGLGRMGLGHMGLGMSTGSARLMPHRDWLSWAPGCRSG